MGEGKQYWATVSVVTGKWVSPLENDGVRYFRTKWIIRVGKEYFFKISCSTYGHTIGKITLQKA